MNFWTTLGLFMGKKQKIIGLGLNFMVLGEKIAAFYQFFLENVNFQPRFSNFWKKIEGFYILNVPFVVH